LAFSIAWAQTYSNFAIKGGTSGEYPTDIVFSNGAVFGGTEYGGNSNVSGGVVFKITPPAAGTSWKETVLNDLNPTTGEVNFGVLAMPNGTLYGVAANEGNGPCSAGVGERAGCGTIFQMTPPGTPGPWPEHAIWNFQGGADGAYPTSLAVGGGSLFGATANGRGSSTCPLGCGTVFELTPPVPGRNAWTETILYTFQGGADGAYPISLI
jgi:hypothetical protein